MIGGNIEQGRIQSRLREFDDFVHVRHRFLAAFIEHRHLFINRISAFRGADGFHQVLVLAAALLVAAVTGIRSRVAAVELRFKIYVPAVRLHLHIRLVARIRGRGHYHSDDQTTGRVTEHLLAFAGIFGRYGRRYGSARLHDAVLVGRCG